MNAGFLLVFFGALSVQAQGTFQNLDFESANVSVYTPDTEIPISAALPGWFGFYGASQTSVAGYDFISLGAAVISVIDNNAPVFKPIDGNYSAFLFGGEGNGGLLSSAWISQTAVVPSGTQALYFNAYEFGASFIVTLGGQTLNMTAMQTFPNYTLYGGDIPTAFAGQTEALTFSEPPATGIQPSFLELDDISFSTISVTPEPGTLALMLMAVGAYGARRWHGRYSTET